MNWATLQIPYLNASATMIFKIDCALTSFDILRRGYEQLSDQEAEYYRKPLYRICVGGKEQMLQAWERVRKRNERSSRASQIEQRKKNMLEGWIQSQMT
jgi:hypothetical protein